MSFNLFGERTIGFGSNPTSYLNPPFVTAPPLPNGIGGMGARPNIAFASPMQTPSMMRSSIFDMNVASPPSDIINHPCNGMGGSSCECGGSCVGNNNTYNESKLSKQDQLPFNDFSFKRDVLKRAKGCESEVSILYPSDKEIISKATVIEEGQISVKISGLLNTVNALTIIFKRNAENDNWSITNGKVTSNIGYFPDELQLDFLNITVLSTIIGINGVKAKDDRINFQTNLQKSLGIEEDKTKCINHDLVCSDVVGIKFTSDRKHIRWTAACIGSFDVPLEDCCKKHDIGLWCAGDPGGAALANIEVINCILRAIVAETNKRMKDADIVCKFINVIWNAFVSALDFIVDVLVGVWNAIGMFVMPIVQIIDFLTGGDLIKDAAYDTINQIFLYGKLDYVGYDEHRKGKNYDSCLCGGRSPTVQCDGNHCLDLCKEYAVGDGKGHENCFNCHWECVYENGKLSSPIWRQSNTQACCPGTSQNCRGDHDGHLLNCPTCSGCYYDCEIVKDPKTGLPTRIGSSHGFNFVYKPKLFKDIEGLDCCNIPRKIDCSNYNRREK